MEEINKIEYKKKFYKIKAPLKVHLKNYGRLTQLPIDYEDLTNYTELIPVTDQKGNPTLWYSALYSNADLENLQKQLTRIYELLVNDGDPIPYLIISAIEFCSFGNSKPFRIKVLNEINDNHDYYYIKRADASRIYGLELEDIFSPDKVSYLVDKETLIEEHIVGIPCDEFILKNKEVKIENRTRFAKEFVKFNERCFTRLLGDMRAYNFVVEIIQDFDNVQYRLRAIDFDQQNFEGRKSIYMPQFYKDNKALVELTIELFSPQIAEQYMKEERVAMRKRYYASQRRTRSLLRIMKKDVLSLQEHINQLKKELSSYHKTNEFLEMKTMGEILTLHLEKKLGIEIFPIKKII